MHISPSWIKVLSGYAVIELELLAVTWAIHNCNLFLARMQQFQVITDHHPLISILDFNEIQCCNTKDLFNAVQFHC